MDEQELLTEIYRDGHRQGPGSDDMTRWALAASGLIGRRGLEIADLGCGTGASTLVLAQDLDAHITAVDLLSGFLDELDHRAAARGLRDRITPLEASMDELPFAEESLDAIWSEGAVYNIGFETGVRQWRRLLRPGGVIAVSELTWTSAIRPVELERYWDAQYPEVATASEKLAILERHGFTPLAYGLLPERCWTDEFYTPLWQRLDEFLDRHAHHDTATALVDEIRDEMSWFERYSAHVGYGFYVARRIDS